MGRITEKKKLNKIVHESIIFIIKLTNLYQLLYLQNLLG